MNIIRCDACGREMKPGVNQFKLWLRVTHYLAGMLPDSEGGEFDLCPDCGPWETTTDAFFRRIIAALRPQENTK